MARKRIKFQKVAMDVAMAAAGGLGAELIIDAANNNIPQLAERTWAAPAILSVALAVGVMQSPANMHPLLYGAMGVSGAELGRDAMAEMGLGNITFRQEPARIIGESINRRIPITQRG